MMTMIGIIGGGRWGGASDSAFPLRCTSVPSPISKLLLSLHWGHPCRIWNNDDRNDNNGGSGGVGGGASTTITSRAVAVHSRPNAHLTHAFASPDRLCGVSGGNGNEGGNGWL